MVERRDFNVVRAVRKIPAPTREESRLWLELVSEAMKKPEADEFLNSLHENIQNPTDEVEIVLLPQDAS